MSDCSLQDGERPVFSSPVRLDRESLARATLPPPLRSHARLGVLDISEFFGETSGGVRTYLLRKARHVAADPALRQVLLVPGARDLVVDGPGVRCYRLRGPTIPSRKPYRFMLAPRSAARIVAHERPDLLEVGSSWLGPWLVLDVARKAQLPVVWFFHDHFPRIIGRTLGGGRELVSAAWAYARAVAGRCRVVLAPSDFVARDLEANGIDRVARVTLGVDLECLSPQRRSASEQVRHDRGLTDAPLVLFVGRIAPEKQLHRLLAAWPDVARRTGARLVLVGDGPERARLGTIACSRSVVWLPFEPDRTRLADLFATADVYVSPSSVETFGLAALEALASGTPVVASDAGGVAELVTRSGAGLLYPEREPGAIAETLVAALESDRGELSRRARQYAETHHAWPTVLSRLFALYHDLVTA